MTWYEAYSARLHEFSVPAWEDIPDLGLYMDQVITYLERLLRPLFGDTRRIVTSSMINNYVKGGLVARPVGKKYDRRQIAQLVMLCSLKQALSLEDMRKLMTPPAGQGIEEVYRTFCGQIEQVSEELSSTLDSQTPLRCAVLSAAYGLLCEEILGTEISETP